MPRSLNRGIFSMKKIGFIARQGLKDCYTRMPLNDVQLKALDGYFVGVLYVDDNADSMDILSQFEELYPNMIGWALELIYLEAC